MEKIYLRKAELSDCENLLNAFKRSAEYLQPWTYTPVNIERYISQQDVYMLCYEKEIAGVFSLSGIVRGAFHSAYLGYNAFVPYQGKGYMSAGMNLLLKEAFDNVKLHRLEANIQPENFPSKKLVEKMGFQKEGFSQKYLNIGGEWKDHERWAILNDHWQEDV